jgi:hypothetical protein
MKFTIIAKGTHSIEWPKFELYVNAKCQGSSEVIDICELDFDIDLGREQNFIEICYSNKSQHHTVLQDGQVIQDQCLELLQVRIDDILCNSWVLTEGYYHPRYFTGFLESFPDAPTRSKSQLIWHFPGTFRFPPFPRSDQFWHWYCQQRREVHIQSFQGKNQHRMLNYRGELDPCQDLIEDIQKIIDA